MKRAIGLAALLALAACDACSGGKVTIQAAPVVQWDGGADDAVHACLILKAANCPVADGCDTTDAGVNCPCARMFRADQASGVGSMFSTACVVGAGAAPAALRACGFTCGAEP